MLYFSFPILFFFVHEEEIQFRSKKEERKGKGET